ncbi:hypothetical protein [Chitinophaga sp. S165]|uniref:hypothetical protein n=1 Tax=Chitinophaga sp. S165 TaxID=2135462 RepID=UPI000D716221|nr:hypothetical protein [Chitinophaga sp. S165]PWV55657.1 hypothetical protein C7475_101163 [Chitinophaga sp. S165]
MIQFINPVDILNLAATDLASIDDTVIKRAKKAALAEIDLSDDGFFHYHEQQLTRSDCERVINELEEHDKLEFYHFIANSPALNKFLINGDESFFTAFRHESIYKLPEFVKFISPYFAAAYDSALWKAWQQYTNPIDHIVAVDPIVVTDDMDNAYKSVRNDLNRKIEDIRELYAKVEDLEQEVNLKAIAAQADILLDKDRLNTLPPYFQDLRNTMVLATRKLAIQINNVRGDSAIGRQLVETLREVQTDGVTKEKLVKDYELLRNAEKHQADANDPVRIRYNELVAALTEVYKAASNPQSSVPGVRKWVDEHINIEEIKALDVKYHNIKIQLATKLGGLGAAIYKGHRERFAALDYIEMAEQIGVLEGEPLDMILDFRKILQQEIAELGVTPDDPHGINKKVIRDMIIIGTVIIIIVIFSKGCF